MKFKLDYLDHVAIRVKDPNAAAEWYENVLCLERYQLPAWGEIPIFMLSGKTGVAIFPANLEDQEIPFDSKNVNIDHFAFNVTQENFEKAKLRYRNLGIVYRFKDHTYFHSIYTTDLDGHTVELTTLVVEEASFFKPNK